MAVKKILVEEFLEMTKSCPVFDVRSPGEYNHAHISAAHSLPLFTDEERKIVGTLYKQDSREKAIKKGLEFFGVKMVKMVEEVETLIGNKPKIVLVHCWRGGMRSAGVAWLLDLYGFTVYTLSGGYKSYRHWVLEQFTKPYPFKIIGGFTGSGKTIVLQEMEKIGFTTIDLEGLAHHKGSAFGGINMPVQPSQEMFENKLAIALNDSNKKVQEQNKFIYLEDESQRIGLVNIPTDIWNQMRNNPVYFLQIPFDERLQHIVSGYGKGDKEKLVNAVMRIKKRLGGLETKNAINFLLEDNTTEAFRVLLFYYDKQYQKGLENRDNWEQICTNVVSEKVNPAAIAKQISLLETQQIHV